MDTTDKVLAYLIEHKTPVTPGTLAKKFIISQSKTYKILDELVAQDKVEAVRVGKHDFYKVKSG